ncbi:MAG: hypothetical protein JXR87_01955, partial [Candidatus Marinimicrobia bacterium]|nr:hypothetical protein [Candidatus Neomarinimicrobiota bacterium]
MILLLILTFCGFSFIIAQESGFPDVSWGVDESENVAANSYEEVFSLYGYMIDYFQSSLNYTDHKFSRPTFGNALLLRLKGDWRPENNLRFHMEFSYISNVGNQNPYLMYEKLGIGGFAQSDFPLEDFNQHMFFDHVWGMVNIGNFDMQFG